MNKTRRRHAKQRSRARKRRVCMLNHIREFFDALVYVQSFEKQLHKSFHEKMFPEMHYVSIEMQVDPSLLGGAP